MFKIDKKTKQIKVTRGDVCSFKVSAMDENVKYTFEQGDVVRFKILKAQDYKSVEFYKDVYAVAGTKEVTFDLTSEDTKLGDIINKPVNYVYEVELNPNTTPQTILGYDDDGAKLFTLYPEGADVNE